MIVLPIIVTLVLFLAVSLVHLGVSGFGHRSGRERDTQSWYGFAWEDGQVRLPSDVIIYTTETGEHIVTFADGFVPDFASGGGWRWVIPILAVTLLGVVFLVNRALTGYISRSITTPIDTLVDGVREISEGNLGYRIRYNKDDEFAEVCADFNEMAARLSDMVRQRQLDEAGRKELIAGISHDLRTPLTSIKAYIEGLRKGVASTAAMREKYLDIIHSKTEDIEYIINQLFLFSKLDIGEFPLRLESVDIGAELEKMVTGLSDEYAERGLGVSLAGRTHGAFVSVDVVQLRNVVQNILGNSVKYCGRPDARAEISCRQSAGDVIVTIADNGPGVPEGALGKIFEVFYRSDQSRNNPSKGSGLGLAISAKIVGQLGGTITAENTPQGGLAIIITLPLSEGGHTDEANTDS